MKYLIWIPLLCLLLLPVPRPEAHACCHVKLAVQDDPPEHACSTRPKGQEVNCKCKRECNDEGRRAPAPGGKAECQAWCHEKFCLCHPPCVID